MPGTRRLWWCVSQASYQIKVSEPRSCIQIAENLHNMQLVAVTKLTSASGLDSESFWAAMNAQEIPSKVELHASFTGCTATC